MTNCPHHTDLSGFIRQMAFQRCYQILLLSVQPMGGARETIGRQPEAPLRSADTGRCPALVPGRNHTFTLSVAYAARSMVVKPPI